MYIKEIEKKVGESYRPWRCPPLPASASFSRRAESLKTDREIALGHELVYNPHNFALKSSSLGHGLIITSDQSSTNAESSLEAQDPPS